LIQELKEYVAPVAKRSCNITLQGVMHVQGAVECGNYFFNLLLMASSLQLPEYDCSIFQQYLTQILFVKTQSLVDTEDVWYIISIVLSNL
jgi:hypothetical protein